MSLWGAFTNSVQAMQTQSHSLGVISQNVANVNTPGYKEAQDIFKTNLSEVTAKTNIFGVKPITRQLIDYQGPITASNTWKDLAVNGEGFFITNSNGTASGTTSFTRSGAFSTTNIPPAGTSGASTGSGLSAGTTSSTTTSGPITYLVDGAGNYLMGYSGTTGPMGTGSATSDTSNLVPLQYQMGSALQGAPTSSITLQGTLPSNATTPQAQGLPVYDQSLNSQTLTMNWTQTGANTWSLSYSMDPKAGSVTNTPTTVTFDGNGKIVSPTSSTANVTWADGSSSAINVSFNKLQQLASGTFNMDQTTQDGFPTGYLNQLGFDSQGMLNAGYTNGKTQVLGQVAIAQFRNPNGLETKTGTTFGQTADAGAMQVGTVGSFPSMTSISPNSLEQSNVKLEDQFSQMIITQKAYSSASEVFKTADEMTQSARDLKR